MLREMFLRLRRVVALAILAAIVVPFAAAQGRVVYVVCKSRSPSVFTELVLVLREHLPEATIAELRRRGTAHHGNTRFFLADPDTILRVFRWAFHYEIYVEAGAVNALRTALTPDSGDGLAGRYERDLQWHSFMRYFETFVIPEPHPGNFDVHADVLQLVVPPPGSNERLIRNYTDAAGIRVAEYPLVLIVLTYLDLPEIDRLTASPRHQSLGSGVLPALAAALPLRAPARRGDYSGIDGRDPVPAAVNNSALALSVAPPRGSNSSSSSSSSSGQGSLACSCCEGGQHIPGRRGGGSGPGAAQ